MIGRFFRWWGGELASLFPGAMRQGPERGLKTLRFVPDGFEMTVERGAGDRFETLGVVPRPGRSDGAGAERATTARGDALKPLLRGFNPRRTRVEVRLPSEQALSKVVELPDVAEENLHQVLGFEMERLTPFKRDDVYYSGRVIDRDAGAKQIRVQLNIAPKGAVDEALDLVAEWPLARSGKTVRLEDEGEGFVVRFYPRNRSTRASSRLNSVLLAAILVLLGVAVALPLVQQQRLLDSLRGQVKAVRAAAGAATALRERLDEVESEMRFIAGRKSAAPAVVQVIEEVSAVLPDTTYLTRLQLQEGTLVLHGTSDSASALIPIIEQSRLLENVRFDSPVTQLAATGRERFQLSADIVTREAR